MQLKNSLLLICLMFLSYCYAQEKEKYLFFLHNRFLETNSIEDEHPDYGKVEYVEILEAFRKEGFKVISEKRSGNINARAYAIKVVNQIDSLLSLEVEPTDITVVGTSKGGYIAQYVSTLAENPDLNFVFIGSYTEADVENIPQINFCGNILTIYERTDPAGVSAIERKRTSSLKVNHFNEIELNTSLNHGFLFKALPEWIEPTVKWANGNYQLE